MSPIRMMTSIGGVLLLAGAAFFAAPAGEGESAAAPAPAATPGLQAYYAMVRADYIATSGNNLFADAFVEVTNMSPVDPLVLGDIYAIDRHGVNGILSTASSLQNVTIPPLGRRRFPVDPTFFPGLQPRLGFQDTALAHVVVECFGYRPEQVWVTCHVESRSGGSSDSRDVVHYEARLIPTRP